jgi:hypothetical protein
MPESTLLFARQPVAERDWLIICSLSGWQGQGWLNTQAYILPKRRFYHFYSTTTQRRQQKKGRSAAAHFL